MKQAAIQQLLVLQVAGKVHFKNFIFIIKSYRRRNFYQEAPITTMPIETYRQKVSYCFQQPTLFGETVYDNLLFPFTVRQEAFNQEKVVALLQQVKLPAAYLEKKIAELSGGERQRVALLRNIIFVPDVLLLDEVTTGLDEESKQIVNQLLNQLNKEQGVTLVRVTHDTEEIQQAQQVIRIVAGRWRRQMDLAVNNLSLFFQPC